MEPPLSLTLTPEEIAIIERYLPQLANILNTVAIKQSLTLRATKPDLQNLQKALSEVLMAYGFDENYDANAVGIKAENLIYKIQFLLRA